MDLEDHRMDQEDHLMDQEDHQEVVVEEEVSLEDHLSCH